MLSRVEASLVDPIGDLYEGDDCFYRAIKSESVDVVQSLMSSGLVDELVSQGLFPETEISSKEIEGYPLVLRHRKIGVPSYPFEWSPEMLRAAGLSIAQVNDICNEFGYELKDAHPYNIVFEACAPMFVDFGSIQRRDRAKRDDWSAADEFERTFRYPLYFYSKGAHALFHNAFLSPGKTPENSDYLTFRFAWLRLLPKKLFKLWVRAFTAYKRFACLDFKTIGCKWPKWKRELFEFLQSINVIPVTRQTSARMGKRLSRIQLKHDSTWGQYHLDAGFLDDVDKFAEDERFQHVLGLIEKAQPKIVTELAGNQGILAEHVAKLDFVEKVICCDYDEQAIDSLFLRCRRGPMPPEPLVLDFMLPRCTALTERVEGRIKGDLVIALAVTHHLTLSQGYGFDSVFRAIARYTTRHAIVEFMPLGLWDGNYSLPLPDWYNEESFREGLAHCFEILEKSQVQSNRIVYFLEKMSPAEREHPA